MAHHFLVLCLCLVSGRVCHWWIVFWSNPVEVPGSFCRTFPVIGASFGAAHGRSAAAAEQSKGGDGEGAAEIFRETCLVVFSKSVVGFWFLPKHLGTYTCENNQHTNKKFDEIRCYHWFGTRDFRLKHGEKLPNEIRIYHGGISLGGKAMASQLSQEPALHGSLAALLNAHGWARLTGRMQPLPVLLVVS